MITNPRIAAIEQHIENVLKSLAFGSDIKSVCYDGNRIVVQYNNPETAKVKIIRDAIEEARMQFKNKSR